MRLALFFVLLAASVYRANALDAHFEGDGVVINDSSKSIHISGVINSDAFYGIVHAIQKRGRYYYLVVGTSWPSRGSPAKGGMCGAGIESSIKWLQIKDAKIMKEQEGRYESCFKHRDGWSIDWKGRQLIWTTEAFEYRDDSRNGPIINRSYTWTFDLQKPEAGILEEKNEAEQGAAGQPPPAGSLK